MSAFQGKVLVIGASGETGQLVVRELRKQGIEVRALVRSQEKGKLLQGEGVELYIGDLTTMTTAEQFAPLLADISGVISTIGSRGLNDIHLRESVEYEAVVRLIDAVKAAKIGHFVFTTSSSTEHPERVPFLTEILKVKRRTELYLINSGLPYTIVRPGGLVNDPPLNDVAVGRGDLVSGRISRADVATLLVQALLQPEAKGQIVEIFNQTGAGAADRPGLFA
jgi:uncharacterized protein YbjT (DUF2867 family)